VPNPRLRHELELTRFLVAPGAVDAARRLRALAAEDTGGSLPSRVHHALGDWLGCRKSEAHPKPGRSRVGALIGLR